MNTRLSADLQTEKPLFPDEADLQEALNDVFRNLSSQIPVDKIHWVQTHYDLQMIRIIAQVSGTGGEKTNFMYDVPEQIIAFLSSTALPEIHIMNQPEIDPIGKEVSGRAKLFDWSAMFINLRNHPGRLSSVAIYADGKGRYTKEHTRPLKAFSARLQQISDLLVAHDEKKIPGPAQKEPVKDKNEFFRQVTLRLCGNLDLETGVTQCLQYLSRFMPADALFVRQLEPELQSERVLAESFGVFHQKSGTLIPWITRERPSADRRRVPRMRIINRPEQSVAMQPYTQMFGHEISCISMPLIHNKKAIGVAVLGLEGKDRYREEHMRLFGLLHDPFVLALSNNIRHREMIRLKNLIEEEKQGLAEELHYSAADTIIGGSLGLAGVMENARLVAEQGSPVLLTGETGVGKEIIANFIHRKAARKDGPFIKVNCGAIPDTLMDSELFGHEKGAFTGADTRKKGRFERAHRGTIFLDEIAELPLAAQVRLLRVLQHKIIERVGGSEAIPVDIRIIAATHRDLEELVAQGKFREDLWFRLNVFPIRVPPLRSRRSDIPALVDYFIERKSVDLKLHTRPSLSADAMERLTTYDWPGNVRELENVIERELILSRGEPLTFQNINPRPPGDELPDMAVSTNDVLGLDEFFAGHVKKVLALCNGKINGPGGAAELMKIKPNTLRNRMKKLGIPYGQKKQNHLRNK